MAAGQRAFLLMLFLFCLVALYAFQPARSTTQFAFTPYPLAPLQDQLHEFKLRQIWHHGTRRYPELHRRLDIPSHATVLSESVDGLSAEPLPRLLARSQPASIQRLSDRNLAGIDALLASAREQGSPQDLPPSAWTVDEIRAPNVTDKETVVTLARAAVNSYVEIPETGEWEDVHGGFNYTDDFGWQEDGLRGHVFADADNSTIIIGLKGTSTAIFDGKDTTTNDKENDNLFFGCCCGQGTSYWSRQVCDCQTATYTCNNTCVTQALRQKNRYYAAAQDLYYNATALYPDSEIWLVGHSLGGSLVSLLGKTVGTPVVTFEAPGEAMAAYRLGLPTPPEYHLGSVGSPLIPGPVHFGHTGDPLFMGTCGGSWSGCSIAGYAMESVCHTGLECIYDTVKDKGWGTHLKNHEVVVVLHDVIEAYNETAKCEPVIECYDCQLWKYYESHHSTPTTSSSTSSSMPSYTQTRTQTCKTPGWWGCLDETSSATVPVTTTSTTTISTCLSHGGWFGGCKNSTTFTSTTTMTSSAARTSLVSSTSASCETPGRVWGCKDGKASPASRTATMPTSTGSNVFFDDLR
ncbi:MAG: putative lipase atg15 [Chrysothrix sp. TS-e1954]|nr:MAG: putative lipase atg15 [Chrysothrix sp. TS-e1954]